MLLTEEDIGGLRCVRGATAGGTCGGNRFAAVPDHRALTNLIGHPCCAGFVELGRGHRTGGLRGSDRFTFY